MVQFDHRSAIVPAAGRLRTARRRLLPQGRTLTAPAAIPAPLAGRRAADISHGIQAAVDAGRLREGDALPPVRALAASLGVSPTTVAAAYRELRLRGVVVAAGRRGTRIRPRPQPASAPPPAIPAGVRDLSSGNPDPRLLPDLGPSLRRIPAAQRLYGEPAARAELIAPAAAGFAGGGVRPDHIAVVGGALDGIERVLAAHLRPGDRVAVEDPGYPAVFDLLAALGLVPEPVPIDDRGPLPDALEAASRKVQAVIVTPRGQNPSGAALDGERAAELRDLLSRCPGFLVIEDDHSGPVAGTPAHTLTSRSTERWAVIRSVSKSLGPDIRLAVMAGDATTVSRVESRQRLGAGWVSHVLQSLVSDLWGDEAALAAVGRAAAAYAERRRALVRALGERGFAGHGRSGLNVWVPVADEASASRALLAAGWMVAAGRPYRIRSGPAVRISIGAIDPGEAEEIARVLAGAGERPGRTRSA